MNATVVTVRTGQFSARVTSPSKAVTNVIKRATPAAGREFDQITHEWVIYASRVEKLFTALRAAGFEVVETSVGGAA